MSDSETPQSDATTLDASEAERFAKGARDPSQFAFNVFTSWAAQFVTVISGFVLPRFIDNEMGPEVLGIWDFGWSMYAYVMLSEAGLGSSVAQYVAKYRTHGQWEKLNRVLSVCLSLFCLNALLGLGVTAVLVLLTPTLVGKEHTELFGVAQFVAATLGLAAVIQIPIRVHNGIITGSRRFDVLNIVEGGGDILVLVALIGAVLMGLGLRTLACIALGREILAAGLKIVIAHRLCPRLRPRLTWGTKAELLDIVAFGGKTVLTSLSRVFLYQTNSLLVMYFMGPAALALYTRPRALILHLAKLITGYAKVLLPTASVLGASNSKEQLMRMMAKSTTHALYILVPAVGVLTILGGKILRVWMGDDYDEGSVLTALVIGHCAFLATLPAYHILMGLANHGAVGVAYLVASICSAVLGVLFMGVLGWGLMGAAMSLALPLLLYGLVAVPFFSARAVGMTWRDFCRGLSLGPLLAFIPFTTILVVCSTMLRGRLVWNLAVSMGLGGTMLAIAYWFFVVPTHLRKNLIQTESLRAFMRKLFHGQV